MLGGSMQPDRPALARAWLATALRDLRVADRIRDEEPSLACFHAQQAAEKALKSVAVLAIGDIARSHALLHIVAELTAAGVTVPARVVRACQVLERFYAATRYPDAIGDVDPGEIFTVEDSRETYALGTVVIDFAREAMETDT